MLFRKKRNTEEKHNDTTQDVRAAARAAIEKLNQGNMPEAKEREEGKEAAGAEQIAMKPLSALEQLNVKDYSYVTSPMVCSNEMRFDIHDGCLSNLRVEGGCNGNLQGISRLTEGMRVDDIIGRLGGIRCGGRPDSCPNQLSVALRQCLRENGYETPEPVNA